MTRERDRIQENANKYIVKNCPAILPMTKLCDSENTFNCGTFCKDCTDCVIKQVIEKCKDAKLECSCKNPNLDIDCFECTSGGRAELGQEILNMFDIEEINK